MANALPCNDVGIRFGFSLRSPRLGFAAFAFIDFFDCRCLIPNYRMLALGGALVIMGRFPNLSRFEVQACRLSCSELAG